MNISDIDVVLKKYSQERGRYRKWSKSGLFDQRDIVKLRRFRQSLHGTDTKRGLSESELLELQNLLKNKKTKPGHLSHRLFAWLERGSTFGLLSKDLIHYIGTFLPDEQDKATLSGVNRYLWQHTHADIAKRLVQHIAYGELEQAKKIILKNPMLLLVRVPEVRDHAGRRIINATAFECALGAGDEEAAQWIANQLALNGYDKDRRKQYKKQLPNGWVDAKRTPSDIQALNDVYEAILVASEADVQSVLDQKDIPMKEEDKIPLRNALDTFRKHFSQEGRVVSRGKHLNHQHECDAKRLFENLTHHLSTNILSEVRLLRIRQDLFSKQVIGFLQRGETARGGMERAYGISNRVRGNGADKRSIAPRHFAMGPSAQDFFPLHPSAGIGFDDYCEGTLDLDDPGHAEYRDVRHSTFGERRGDMHQYWIRQPAKSFLLQKKEGLSESRLFSPHPPAPSPNHGHGTRTR